MSDGRREDRNGAPPRRWYIRVLAVLSRPLTLFQGSGGKWSAFRVGWFILLYRFQQNFPAAGEWTPDNKVALALILFALPAESLFGRVPVGETLGAIQAFFSAVMAKSVDKARDAYQSYRYQPPAPGEPPDDSHTPPAET